MTLFLTETERGRVEGLGGVGCRLGMSLVRVWGAGGGWWRGMKAHPPPDSLIRVPSWHLAPD